MIAIVDEEDVRRSVSSASSVMLSHGCQKLQTKPISSFQAVVECDQKYLAIFITSKSSSISTDGLKILLARDVPVVILYRTCTAIDLLLHTTSTNASFFFGSYPLSYSFLDEILRSSKSSAFSGLFLDNDLPSISPRKRVLSVDFTVREQALQNADAERTAITTSEEEDCDDSFDYQHVRRKMSRVKEFHSSCDIVGSPNSSTFTSYVPARQLPTGVKYATAAMAMLASGDVQIVWGDCYFAALFAANNPWPFPSPCLTINLSTLFGTATSRQVISAINEAVIGHSSLPAQEVNMFALDGQPFRVRLSVCPMSIQQHFAAYEANKKKETKGKMLSKLTVYM
jgi:hypothetical protein